MTFPQSILAYFILPILSLLWWLIIIHAIASWLFAFNIINSRNEIVRQLYGMLDGLLRPLYRPIQKVIPSIGGMDLSPIVLLLVISWLQSYLIPGVIYPALG